MANRREVLAGLLGVAVLGAWGCRGGEKGSSEAAARAPGLERVLPRSAWTSVGPARPGEMNPMGVVTRITVHHTGTFAGRMYQGEAAQMIEELRAEHVARGMADIRFHYVIDLAGRVWAGRDARYEGALVQDDNLATLGVACLGDYDSQAPTAQMCAALEGLLKALSRVHGVAPERILGACEVRIGTVSPGKGVMNVVRIVREGMGVGK